MGDERLAVLALALLLIGMKARGRPRTRHAAL
jgi:hypothetical protein